MGVSESHNGEAENAAQNGPETSEAHDARFVENAVYFRWINDH